jgi:hypothetical protein
MDTNTFYTLITVGMVARIALFKSNIKFNDLIEKQVVYAGGVFVGCLGADLGMRISNYLK